MFLFSISIDNLSENSKNRGREGSKLKNTILTLLNKQLNLEFRAFYFYLAISTYFEDMSLSGMAKWMRHQSQEEHGHMMKIYHFLHDRAQIPIFDAVPIPKVSATSVEDAFRTSLKHEKSISESIHDIADKALKEGDLATFQFLQWFIEEQVEEESHIQGILDKLLAYGEEPQFLYLLDQELGTCSHDH